MNGNLRVAVDIGGTFTDLVVMDRDTGGTFSHKVLSTPQDPSIGMLRGLDDLGCIEQIEYLVHGTTAGLNALLSRAGERTALIATEGFRDVLRLRRAGNDDIWNLRAKTFDPLVADSDVRTVRERMRHDGSIEVELNRDDVELIADWLEAEQVHSVAVCLIHAHRNPINEDAVKTLLLQRLPNISVVLSHEVSPEQGEFERTSTTVATAYVARTVDRYLSNLATELSRRSCRAPLQVMRSSGGVCSADLVSRQPIQTILSGPAGGVVAAETLAQGLDRRNMVAIDMGGTSSDVSLVIDGEMTLRSEGAIGEHILRMPVVELHTIGAGGGSIARVESGGLRVGPQSAGSDPGPACYGQGGDRPTVTDAQVLLGRLDPEWFLGGRMRLDLDAAGRVLRNLGEGLGLDEKAAAEGVLAVANGLMANAIRTLALRRGVDPREFSLLAFGGAGPLHAVALAEELGIREVIVPQSMGVLSAWGMLHSDVRHDVSSPLAGHADDSATLDALSQAETALMRRAEALLDLEGVPADRRSYLLSVDMRYVGQEHALPVVVDDPKRLSLDFHDAYRRHYGHSMPQSPAEFVNARLVATGKVAALLTEPPAPDPVAHGSATRSVRFEGRDIDTRVVHRDSLGDGSPLPGPVIVQEEASTTLIPPGWSVQRGRFGALIVTKLQRSGT